MFYVKMTAGPHKSSLRKVTFMNGPIPSSWSPLLLSLLRIVAGLSYATHGTQKLFGVPGAARTFDVMTQMGAAGIIETTGGVLLLLGIFTRPVAFICAGQMAAAYFIAHASQSFWPILNGGELASLYCFIFLFIAAAGPGPLSLDALFFGKRR